MTDSVGLEGELAVAAFCLSSPACFGGRSADAGEGRRGCPASGGDWASCLCAIRVAFSQSIWYKFCQFDVSVSNPFLTLAY